MSIINAIGHWQSIIRWTCVFFFSMKELHEGFKRFGICLTFIENGSAHMHFFQLTKNQYSYYLIK